MPQWLTQILYLISAVFFIIGIKRLGSPATARRGNLISLAGMILAILVTLADRAIISYWVILAGVVVGTALGLWQAYTVKMTAMPQMVALLNGWGGAASMIVSAAEFLRAHEAGALIPTPTGVVMQAGLLVGGVTLTGSLVAFAKLQEIMPGRPITFPAQNASNALVFLTIVGPRGGRSRPRSRSLCRSICSARCRSCSASCSSFPLAALTCQSSFRCSTRIRASPRA